MIESGGEVPIISGIEVGKSLIADEDANRPNRIGALHGHPKSHSPQFAVRYPLAIRFADEGHSQILSKRNSTATSKKGQGPLLDRIFKSHAFRIVVLEPSCGCLDVGEDFSNGPLGDKDRHRSRGIETAFWPFVG
jgi:hypothetical protein